MRHCENVGWDGFDLSTCFKLIDELSSMRVWRWVQQLTVGERP